MNSDGRFIATRRAGSWAVKCESTDEGVSLHANEFEAWAEARRRARGAAGEAVLHGRQGAIKTINRYGNTKR
jgi:hypothetical protein